MRINLMTDDRTAIFPFIIKEIVATRVYLRLLLKTMQQDSLLFLIARPD